MSVLFFFLFFIGSPGALAAYSNYNSILIGDQASGMGGAYAAMFEDVSAIPYYNPAGLSHLKGKSFSAAVGIYKKFDTVFGADEDITAASLRVNQGFFRPLPSSTGSVVRFEEFFPNVTFAFSILTPEYDTFKGQVSKTDSNISIMSFLDESLWVGGAFAKELGENSSAGLSVYYTARSMQRSVTDRSFSVGNDKIYNEEKDIKENSLVFILGYLKQLNPDWRLGVSYQFRSLRIAGYGTYYDSLIETGQTTLANTYTELVAKTRIPDKLRVGLSWQALDELVLTLDVTHHGADSFSDVEEPSISELLRHEAITNINMGGELVLRDWLKVRAGFFTNFSSHPDPIVGESRGQADRVDQLGFSANVVLTSGPIQYTFGGYYTGGRGRSVQRIDHSYIEVPKVQQVFTMLVGTSYLF